MGTNKYALRMVLSEAPSFQNKNGNVTEEEL